MELSPDERKALYTEAESIRTEVGTLQGDDPESKRRKLRLLTRYEEIRRLLGVAASKESPAPGNPEPSNVGQSTFEPLPKKEKERQLSFFSVVSGLVMAAGIAIIVAHLGMSVVAPNSDVVNIGLIHTREVGVQLGGFILVTGAVLLIAAEINHKGK